jgi:hypothetical protein
MAISAQHLAEMATEVGCSRREIPSSRSRQLYDGTSEHSHERASTWESAAARQHGHIIQEFGSLRLLPIALSYEAQLQSCQLFNQVLADTMILYSLYKKHHS